MDDSTFRRTRSKRTRLLDDLAEQYQSVKRTRFERVVAGLLEDVDCDSSDTMSLSDISGVSGDNSELHSEQDASDSDESASFSDIEDDFLAARGQMILRLMTEIEATRVIDPMPRIEKASQLYLLDEWRAISHPNFRKKLRVEPEVFDGLHELIVDHPIFQNNSGNPQLPFHLVLSIQPNSTHRPSLPIGYLRTRLIFSELFAFIGIINTSDLPSPS
ncbi:hypothetical protein B0H13DRAFT_1923917 [Mycena leptocephala]|nr:hypothetical protein B0H13DRAFT_1923917 [Mycena leptocephala]